LRTFHEECSAARPEPLRLSFYGGGHYDPLVQTRSVGASGGAVAVL
jgi:hypothetical protein